MKLSGLLSILWLAGTLAAFAADGTAEIAAPVSGQDTNAAPVPGKIYTNSVGMVLLQMPEGYWAGQYEVTQKEYQKIMGANPSEFTGDTQPVENVSWKNAMDFCDKITAYDFKKKFLPEGFRYTLPTESEWTNLLGGATLESAVTSLGGGRRAGSSPVGSLGPNDLGLYDVRGNVMEFCLGDPTAAFRYLKGGSWADFVDVNLRPDFRWYCKPDETTNTFGFRCLLKAN
jgi:formylglycine-generating enzyme required for sulfatase activity